MRSQRQGSTRVHGWGLRAATLLLLAASLVFPHAPAVAADASALWVLDQRQVKRVDFASNQFTQTISLARAGEAIAFDARTNVLWVLSSKHLLRFGDTGALLADFDLNPLIPPGDSLRHLAIDFQDGSAWVAGDKKTVLHIGLQGTVLAQWTAPQDVRAIALDADRSLWVLTRDFLHHLSMSAALLESAAVPPDRMPDALFLAVDPWGDYLWIADKTHLIRISAGALAATPLSVALPAPVAISNPVDAILVRPVVGSLWMATNLGLVIFDRDGALLRTVSLSQFAFGRVPALTYDDRTSSLWLGGGKAVGRFTASGDFVASPAESVDVGALAAAPFRINPVLGVIAPAPGSVTSNARPALRLGLGAECNGAPCAAPGGYLQSLSLTALLNGQAVGQFFTLAASEAAYTPTTPLPEGVSTLTAQAHDVFGTPSNPVSVQFMVDTVPPSFLSISPADESIVDTSSITITGQVDDPGATVGLLDASGNVIASGSASFSFSVTLAPGLNLFSLSARDAAGNSTTIPYRLMLGTKVTIDSPANGTVSTGDSVLVSGTVQGPTNTGVAVNGVVATLDAGGGSTRWSRFNREATTSRPWRRRPTARPTLAPSRLHGTVCFPRYRSS
jgi:hypothetical protein